MYNLFFGPGSFPFSVALGIVLGIAILEVILMTFGAGLMGLGFDADADVDLNGDGHADGTSIAEWLHVGDLPTLMLWVLFLGGFGITGLLIQIAFNGGLSAWLVAIPAILVGVASVRFIGGAIQNVLRRSEGSTVSSDALIGSEATIVLGATHRGTPTQAKLRDRNGQVHYVLVEPLREEDHFANGDTVVLVQRDGPKYLAIENRIDRLFELSPQDLPGNQTGKA